MEEISSRHSGPATISQSYRTEFAVECPRCKHEAAVTAASPWFLNDGQLNCSHCNYSEKAANLVRYKVSVRAHCSNCGKPINKVIPRSKEKVDGLAISCSACGETITYRTRNEEYIYAYKNSGQASDPIFNLPLWLQENIRGNSFWAYNRLHLHDIKQYVGAKLWERQTTNYTTMVERLPGFIKEAKNRELLIRTIEKLERK